MHDLSGAPFLPSHLADLGQAFEDLYVGDRQAHHPAMSTTDTAARVCTAQDHDHVSTECGELILYRSLRAFADAHHDDE